MELYYTETLKCLQELSDNDFSEKEVEEVVQLANLCMSYNFFTIDNKLYKQQFGTSRRGTPALNERS